MNNKEFISLDGRHKINITYIDKGDFCYFNIERYEIENKKTFCYMFKDVIEFMKKNNIRYIKQRLTNDVIKNFSKSEIIKIDENESMVISDIKYFAIEVYIALCLISSEFIYEIEE